MILQVSFFYSREVLRQGAAADNDDVYICAPRGIPWFTCKLLLCLILQAVLPPILRPAACRACNIRIRTQPLLAGTLTTSLLDSESLHGGSPLSGLSRPITPLSDLSLYSAAASLRAGNFSPHVPPPPWYTRDIIAGEAFWRLAWCCFNSTIQTDMSSMQCP
jgi:hypothetical protein